MQNPRYLHVYKVGLVQHYTSPFLLHAPRKPTPMNTPYISDGISEQVSALLCGSRILSCSLGVYASPSRPKLIPTFQLSSHEGRGRQALRSFPKVRKGGALPPRGLDRLGVFPCILT